MACWILVPSPGIEPASLALEARSGNHWTAREVLRQFPVSEDPCFLDFEKGSPLCKTHPPTPPTAVCIYSFGIKVSSWRNFSNCLLSTGTYSCAFPPKMWEGIQQPRPCSPSSMFFLHKPRKINIFSSFKNPSGLGISVWTGPSGRGTKAQPTEPCPT